MIVAEYTVAGLNVPSFGDQLTAPVNWPWASDTEVVTGTAPVTGTTRPVMFPSVKGSVEVAGNVTVIVAEFAAFASLTEPATLKEFAGIP